MRWQLLEQFEDFLLVSYQVIHALFGGRAHRFDTKHSAPDKQDVAARLLLEIQRVAYGSDVVSRGPELIAVSSPSEGTVVLRCTFGSMLPRGWDSTIIVGN